MLYLFPFLLFACKNSQEETQAHNPLFQEVMVIHDNVMPEMTTIHQLKKELKLRNTELTSPVLSNHINKLELADEAMMEWMAQFKLPEDKTKETEYLVDQKEKIRTVSQQLYTVIHEAQVLIDSLNEP
jgi:hypothetical protein